MAAVRFQSSTIEPQQQSLAQKLNSDQYIADELHCHLTADWGSIVTGEDMAATTVLLFNHTRNT